MLRVISLGAESPGGLAPPAATSAPDRFYGPRGLVLIGSTLIVCDTGNHRVLVFRDLCDGIVSPKASTILGQPDFYSESHSNGGGSQGLFLPTGVATRDNRLIVGDVWHHRVLIWDAIPTEDWTGADHVIGQATMEDVEPNQGGECSTASLDWPFGVGFVEDRFFIADTGNRRILGWDHLPLDGELPEVIVGQSDFNSRHENRGEVGPSSFRWPHSVVGDCDGMYVADAGNHTVLMFDLKIDKDCDALCVIGQVDPCSNSEWPYGLQPQMLIVFHMPLPKMVTDLWLQIPPIIGCFFTISCLRVIVTFLMGQLAKRTLAQMVRTDGLGLLPTPFVGHMNFAGVSRDVCFASWPDVKVGDYVLVHVGFALTVLDESSDHETLAIFRDFGLIDGELGSDAEIVPQRCALLAGK
ncbi:HypC/HybG/HupF family hydrogenase formation chaperone [Acidithrix sp. C25]|uniref:HypC/HybG/HupF family hydrogenase formation chaperone n=1 Tax=Acidithrix sp. C25 TaxID=1671482 RepID=UPI00191BC0C8|nr:HypC/HybG/HupF family hydrogenase formation chaperone [Acidithrix sp. C25]CAG4932608.1 unnamed protein product [Acidithrix sp. C25]